MTDDGLRTAVQMAPPFSIIILEDVDALFDEWDRDGSGVLDCQELEKILKNRR